MKTVLQFLAVAAVVIFPQIEQALAADKANWKIGRVYNRLVCNSCHRQDGGKVVSPYDRNKVDWTAYFLSDAHDVTGKTNPSVRHYMSTDYRQSIKSVNKAAAKFVDMPNAQMEAHVIAFYHHGAKDSDTPAKCQ